MLACWIGSLVVLHVWKLVPRIHLERSYILVRVVPLSLLFFTNIVLGNVSLRWVSVSFMQTVKASVPFFSVLLQVFCFGKNFDIKTYISLIPIVGGVMLATYTETEYNAIGFYTALIASIITALLAIVSGLILSKDLDSLNLMYYMAPISFLMLYPVAHFTEITGVIEWYHLASSQDLVLLLISSLVAYLLNVTSFLVIYYSSALTYNIAGNFKVIFSIVISVLVFQNKITLLNAAGCAVAIIGVGYYNWIKLPKQNQSRNQHKDEEIQRTPPSSPPQSRHPL